MVLLCQLVSEDHMIKKLSYMDRSPSRLVTIVSSLVAIGIIVVILLVCHMISQDHVIIWSCDFMRHLHGKSQPCQVW